jgi:hypothetical protein
MPTNMASRSLFLLICYAFSAVSFFGSYLLWRKHPLLSPVGTLDLIAGGLFMLAAALQIAAIVKQRSQRAKDY